MKLAYWLALIVLLFAIGVSYVKRAELSPPKPRLRVHDPWQVCQNAVELYCLKVKPGQGRWARCVLAHPDIISPRCRKFAEAVSASVQNRAAQDIKAQGANSQNARPQPVKK